MKAIQIKNLRSIADCGRIELLPITILVGANGSGKSTILRTFPLLRQSIETPTDSPILWYGRFVDFGSIANSLNFQKRKEGLELTFSIDIPLKEDPFEHTESPLLPLEVSIKISENNLHTGSYVSQCKLSFEKERVLIEYKEDGSLQTILINDITIIIPKGARVSNNAYLIPSFEASAPEKKQKRMVFQPFSSSPQRDPFYFFDFDRIISKEFFSVFLNVIRQQTHLKVEDQKFLKHFYNMPLFPHKKYIEHFCAYKGGKSWKELISKFEPTNPSFEMIRAYSLLPNIPYMLKKADETIAEFVSEIQYMGPIRANARRYYRVQDLSVHELDYQGENLAMFIRSLSDEQKLDFSEFSKGFFDFSIESESIEGHVAICLQHKDGKKVNLTDTGFGYSQLLPVVAQLWSAQRLSNSRKPRKKIFRTLAIEQPELHLHPAHQAAIADMMVEAIRQRKNSNCEIRLIIETHSEALINRLGSLIESGNLDPSQVQIIIVEKKDSEESSQITRAAFDKNGALTNWPYGFFSPHK